jgi:hypothetical protein
VCASLGKTDALDKLKQRSLEYSVDSRNPPVARRDDVYGPQL